jgi:DNA-directed RNA polymerase subunit RPC12/RpoP
MQWMNERRRLGERERDCVDCGASFAFKSTLAVRCPPCRRQRKIEQRRAADPAGIAP